MLAVSPPRRIGAAWLSEPGRNARSAKPSRKALRPVEASGNPLNRSNIQALLRCALAECLAWCPHSSVVEQLPACQVSFNREPSTVSFNRGLQPWASTVSFNRELQP